MKAKRKKLKLTFSNKPNNLKQTNVIISKESAIVICREKESKKIIDFLNSKEKIMRISGNPGTGKTHTVLETLKFHKKKYKLINVYKEDLKKINAKKVVEEILILDELDETKEKVGFAFIEKFLNKEKTKVITISNNILSKKTNIHFKPYQPSEIMKLIKKFKLKNEVKDYLSRLSADFRKIKQIFTEIDTKSEILGLKTENISLKEVAEILNPKKEEEVNFHHKIIKKFIKSFISKENGYLKYLAECGQYKIEGMGKGDFETLWDALL